MISLTLILILSVLIYILFSNDMFYVTGAEIGGANAVSVEEIFADSGVAGQHILTIDPDQVTVRIEESPSLETAEVQVQWPARVLIFVREREPALLWEQEGTQYWVDLRGHLMVRRYDQPGMLRIINESIEIPFRCPGPGCTDDEPLIDPNVVQGAQHLKTLRADINVLYYDPVRGLSYLDARGWRGYFGTGIDMHVKLRVYETLIVNLNARGVIPEYIDVSNPDAPYYRATPPPEEPET